MKIFNRLRPLSSFPFYDYYCSRRPTKYFHCGAHRTERLPNITARWQQSVYLLSSPNSLIYVIASARVFFLKKKTSVCRGVCAESRETKNKICYPFEDTAPFVAHAAFSIESYGGLRKRQHSLRCTTARITRWRLLREPKSKTPVIAATIRKCVCGLYGNRGAHMI